jgi:hypothetical protein
MMKRTLFVLVLMSITASLYAQPASSTGTPFVQYLGDDSDFIFSPGWVPVDDHTNRLTLAGWPGGYLGWLGTAGICTQYPSIGKAVGGQIRHYNPCRGFEAGLSETRMWWSNPLRNYLIDAYVYDNSAFFGYRQFMWYGVWQCDNYSGPGVPWVMMYQDFGC